MSAQTLQPLPARAQEAAGTEGAALLDASTSPARGSHVPRSAATGFKSVWFLWVFEVDLIMLNFAEVEGAA